MRRYYLFSWGLRVGPFFLTWWDLWNRRPGIEVELGRFHWFVGFGPRTGRPAA